MWKISFDICPDYGSSVHTCLKDLKIRRANNLRDSPCCSILQSPPHLWEGMRYVVSLPENAEMTPLADSCSSGALVGPDEVFMVPQST
jgi:hypothetical protein